MPAPKKKTKKPASRAVAKPAARPARRVLPAGSKAKGRGDKPASRPTAAVPTLPAHLVAAVRALDDKKAVEIRVIEMGRISSVADFLVVATGTSEPHLRALRIAVEQALDEAGVRSRCESQRDSGWTVVDAFDVLIHVFRDDVRRSYSLEGLWKDGLDVPVAAVLGT